MRTIAVLLLLAGLEDVSAQDIGDRQGRTKNQDSKSQSAQSPPGANAGEPKGDKQRTEPKDEKKGSLEWWQLAVNGWIAVVTTVGIGAALFSLRALRNQTKALQDQTETAIESYKLAERALHLTERADLLIETVSIDFGESHDDPTKIEVILKNYGRTRASNTTWKASLDVPGMEPIQLPTETATTVGTGHPMPMRLAFPWEKYFDNDSLFQIMSGAISLNVNIDVSYQDVFGFSHRTRGTATFLPKSHTFRIDETQAE